MKLIITQYDRCEYKNDVGGCTIGGCCSRRTMEDRADVLCKCTDGLPKPKKHKIRTGDPK